MPCMCWYDPEKREKKEFKRLCENLVKHIKNLEKDGDPLDCTLKDAHTLIDHLYNPSICKESKNNKLKKVGKFGYCFKLEKEEFSVDHE